MVSASKQFVAYYRVSDKKQGDGETSGTGYGIDAQTRAVEFLRQHHEATVIDSQTEIESGSNCQRPKLLAAIAKCEATGATLVVAKLDRLARNVLFIATLIKSKVPFICCDNPHATPLTLHILSAVAEAELESIRSRTRAGLESARRKGKLLGSARPGHWEGKEDKRGCHSDAMKDARKAKHDETRAHYAYLFPQIKLMREGGATLDQIAVWLNQFKHKTTAGKLFTKGTVQRIIARYFDEKVPA